MSSPVERTRVQLSLLEVIALLDAIGGGTGLARAALPVELIEPDSLLSLQAALLLQARSEGAPEAFAPVVENLVAVLASARTTIALRVRGALDRTVLYGVGSQWTADLIISAEECALGLIPTAAVAATLTQEHVVFDAGLDLTLAVRGAGGPVDLVFTDGVIANGRGEQASIRGGGVTPAEFAGLFESAIDAYIS